MKTVMIILAAATLLAVPPCVAHAQDRAEGERTDEELLFLKVPVVVTASRMEQPVTEAPASVTVVTAADIKSYGYRTLADILNSVRGLNISYDRNYQYVGVRGFNRPGDYNSRILLLVDGYRVNDAVYDTASIGTEFFLDVDLIDRVEVMRGPGSSVYGSNAFFGVVNVITRRGRDLGGWEAAGEAASFGAGKGLLAYGQRHENGLESLFSASYSGSRGQDLFFPEYNTPGNNNGAAEGLDYDRASRVFGKLAYGDFTVSGAYSERVKGIPTAAFNGAFNDSRAKTTDTQTFLDLGWYRDTNERMDVSARLFYGGYYYHGFYPYDQPPVTVNKDQSMGEWWGAETRLAGRYEMHRFVAGAEYRDDFRRDQRNVDLDPFALYLDDRRKNNREALYLQDELTLREGLLLNAGLRYDHYSSIGGAVNPRAALIQGLGEATVLKFLYGTAFRAPNAFELYYSDAATSKPASDLKPEEITTYEFVAEHLPRHNVRLTAAAYHHRISNLINQIIDPADGLAVFRNLGRVEANGVEFEAEGVWAGDTRMRASYAGQVARDRGAGDELTNSPRHLAKLNYSVPAFGDALRAGAELQYTGARKTLGNGSAGGYAVANLTLLSSKLAKGLELSASVYNVFDRPYADPGRPEHVQDVIPQDGRSFRLKAAYSF